MKLKHQQFLAIFLIGAMVVIAFVAWNELANRDRGRRAVLNELELEAIYSAQSLETALAGQVQIVRTLGQSPLIIDALTSSNAEYQALGDQARAAHLHTLNARWTAAADRRDPLVHERTTNAVARYLRAHQSRHAQTYGEIFVTNRYGAMIASTGKLTTLAHAHKYWWRAAWDSSEGQTVLDDRGFDDSVAGYVLGIVVPLFDGPRFVGLLKANLNIQPLMEQVLGSPRLERGRFLLLARSGGRVVLQADHEPLSTTLPADVTQALAAGTPGFMRQRQDGLLTGYAPVVTTLGLANVRFVGKAASSDHIKGNAGEAWFILASQSAASAAADLKRSSVLLLWLGGLLILALALVAALVGQRLARPVDALVRYAQRVGSGDLRPPSLPRTSTTEMTRIGEAFTRMVEDLRQTLASRDAFSREVEERKRVEQELRAAREAAEQSALRLEVINKELESFSYSVSHDLRAPLHSIDGFSKILLKTQAAKLDERGRDMLERMRAAAQRMAQLIDDMLTLSRISRSQLERETFDLSALALEVVAPLREAEPERELEVVIQPGVQAHGDPKLIRIVLDNLFNNAWKFTSKTPGARIEFGFDTQSGRPEYFVRDNGAGFDMAYAGKLFGAFQRLHQPAEFPGSGIGLATVARVIHRHGGEVRAQGAVDQGATFWFSLGED